MKMKLNFLLVFLCVLTLYIPTQSAMHKQEKQAIQEQKIKDINLRWGIYGPEGKILEKDYLTINYKEDWKIPHWVAYYISADELKGKVRRTNDFRSDLELPKNVRAAQSDYQKSGYAKSHHAIPEAFKYDKKAMSTTFLFSTISPQTYQLNRSLWPYIDEEIINKAAKMGEAWVFSGNLFLDPANNPIKPFKFIGPNHVAVPTHFFKVVLYQNEKLNYFMEAYLIPNQEKISMSLEDYLYSVDELEKISGYDFFPKLDDEIEKHLESIKPYKAKK